MRQLQHDFWRNLRNEIAAGRQWRDRVVVLTYAVITELVVVAFTLMAEVASKGFDPVLHFGAIGPRLPFVWTPALTVALWWWTQRVWIGE